MAREHILVVEDEEDILELIRYNLQKELYTVSTATTGEEALKIAREEVPQLILLDLMLPGMEGLEVCRQLKKDSATASIPITMVTAKGEETDMVIGLELGAQDYITKPFSPKVLVARVRAVLRAFAQKQSPDEKDGVSVGEIKIHPGRHEVWVKNKEVSLTAFEFRLLHWLISHPGWVFSRQQIISQTQGDDYIVTDRAVDVQVAGLRKKLGPCGKYIETVRRVGYRFKI